MVTSEYPTEANPSSGVFIARQVRALERLGIEISVFAFRGAANPIRYARAWSHVRALLRTGNFDVVHAQFGQSGAVVLPKKLPLVVTFRGSDLHGIVDKSGRYTLAGRVLKNLSRLVARRADAVIIVAESLTKHLPRCSFHVIPSGIDTGVFFPRDREEARRHLNWSSHGLRVLFVGDPDNGVKRFELASVTVAMLPQDMDVELVNAHEVPHEDIPIWMAASDALLLTSKHEGSPNAVKEALAVGLPVVSVDVGDVRSLLENIDGCAVCPDDHPETIARELVRVLKLRARITNSSVVERFAEDRLARKVAAIYDSVVSSSRN